MDPGACAKFCATSRLGNILNTGTETLAKAATPSPTPPQTKRAASEDTALSQFIRTFA